MSLTVGSCFAGIGGLDLGLERAGMRVAWQVERDPFCLKVLAKHWPDIRRHDDINTSVEAGLASVDLICGGVPCQPWSVAGKRKGQDDERDLWPAFWRLCLHLRPRFVLVEEVPGFAVQGGLGRALTDIARAGYDAEWLHLSAADVGAPHRRRRLFVVAYAGRDGYGVSVQPLGLTGSCASSDARRYGPVRDVAYADGFGRERKREPEHSGQQGAPRTLADGCGERGRRCGAELAYAEGEGLANRRQAGSQAGEGGEVWRTPLARSERRSRAWWQVEPDVGRMVDGVPARVDRLRSLGNAVVPQVAEVIGRRILQAVKSEPS